MDETPDKSFSEEEKLPNDSIVIQPMEDHSDHSSDQGSGNVSNDSHSVGPNSAPRISEV